MKYRSTIVLIFDLHLWLWCVWKSWDKFGIKILSRNLLHGLDCVFLVSDCNTVTGTTWFTNEALMCPRWLRNIRK